MAVMSEQQPKSTFQIRADAMIAEGARRVEIGETVTFQSGMTVKILTGYGAWDGRSLVTTGAVSGTGPKKPAAVHVQARGLSVQEQVIDSLSTGLARDWEALCIREGVEIDITR